MSSDEDLRDKLQRLLAQPETCQQFGITARQRYESELTPQRVLDQLVQTYTRLQNGHHVS